MEIEACSALLFFPFTPPGSPGDLPCSDSYFSTHLARTPAAGFPAVATKKWRLPAVAFSGKMPMLEVIRPIAA
jgi:hypothetical protein